MKQPEEIKAAGHVRYLALPVNHKPSLPVPESETSRTAWGALRKAFSASLKNYFASLLNHSAVTQVNLATYDQQMKVFEIKFPAGLEYETLIGTYELDGQDVYSRIAEAEMASLIEKYFEQCITYKKA